MTKIDFTGNIEDIKKQIEQSIATYELLGNRSSINFEVWFERWESGFLDATENRVVGNYPLTGENAWRSDGTKRPRWRQWSSKNGIIEGEYWRDRSVESESIVLSGTAEQLIQHIIQIEYESNSQNQQIITSDIIRYSGVPEITLMFTGFDESKPLGKQRIKGEKSFRYVGYTDNPIKAQQREDLKLITQADINQIGSKIRSIFNKYSWSKGKKQVTYHDWERGYNLNVYASSYPEGERLIIAILAIRNFQPDETFIKYKEPKNPTKAYPAATKITVLGNSYTTEERLPLCEVLFDYAKIYLPTIKETQAIG